MHAPLLSSASIVALAAIASSQQLLETFTGSVGDQFGARLHVTADQNSDGYLDLVIGMPGHNSGRGMVRCLSGRFIATGQGSSVLWDVIPGFLPGAAFGSSIVEVASLTGNNATDFLIGAPGFVGPGGMATTGALILVDGATRAIVSIVHGESGTRLGEELVPLFDQDGDGTIDVAATAPAASGPSKVRIVWGSSLTTSGPVASAPGTSLMLNGSNAFGRALASGFDLDGDGRYELAIGSPDMFSGGLLSVYRADGSWTPVASYLGSVAGERMGASVDCGPDFDGDGSPDLVVGAPNWSAGVATQDGRAVVLSGLRLRNALPQPELFTLTLPVGIAPGNFHFGAAARTGVDLTLDGVAEILVGAPDFFTASPFGPGKGAAAVFSGATGLRLVGVSGANHDRLGDELLAGPFDLDGDGFAEFAVAGSLSDNATVDCGALKFYSLFPAPVASYCTGKVNSLGCTPSVGWSGTPSATAGAPFLVNCAQLINQTAGLAIYSGRPNAAPFQGGELCVKPPLRRSPVLAAGGSSSGADCSGAFTYDLGARIQAGVDPLLAPGAELFLQFWARDPQAASTTSLSNALRLLVAP